MVDPSASGIFPKDYLVTIIESGFPFVCPINELIKNDDVFRNHLLM